MSADQADDLQLLTTKDVTRLLKVGPATVYEAVASGQLRSVPLGGPKSFRFRRQDVADYVEALMTAEPQQQSEPAPLVKGSGRRRNAA